MLVTAQILTLLLVALAMATAIAHALELPGKMRLSQDTYFAVQSIYYPGFTIGGGLGEFTGMLGLLALLFLTPGRSTAFWFTLAASISMLLMHLVFWVFTQPVNRFWLRNQKMSTAGATFFKVGGQRNVTREWTALRDQWEYSHLTRAILSLAAVAFLAVAIPAT